MNRHEHICASIETFAAEVMPEFAEREAARAEKKRRELEPFVTAALARKPRLAPIAAADISPVEALGRKAQAAITTSDRGGAIAIPTADPLVQG
jgi:hypothetical protein